MKKILSILAISVFAIGCQKAETCELNSTGTLKIVSTQLEPFYVYLNTEYLGTAEAATVTTFNDVPAGAKNVQLINVNDANDSYSASSAVSSCEESAVQF